MLSTAMEPVPVTDWSRLGWDGAGAALAVGIRLQDAWAFCFAGTFCSAPPVICCNSVTLSLSALREKVNRGAWKFAMLRFPLTLVEPRDAAKFIRFTEFCENCMFALRTFSG